MSDIRKTLLELKETETRGKRGDRQYATSDQPHQKPGLRQGSKINLPSPCVKNPKEHLQKNGGNIVYADLGGRARKSLTLGKREAPPPSGRGTALLPPPFREGGGNQSG